MQAPLDGPSELLAAEVAGMQVAIRFCRQHIAGWHTTQLTDDQTNAPLTFPIAVCGGRIDKPEWAGEGGAEGFERAILRDRVAEGLRHIAEHRATDTHGADHQARGAERSQWHAHRV